MPNAWKVTLDGKEIDIVFFDPYCDKEYVLRALIEHDGYDPRIQVRRWR